MLSRACSLLCGCHISVEAESVPKLLVHPNRIAITPIPSKATICFDVLRRKGMSLELPIHQHLLSGQSQEGPECCPASLKPTDSLTFWLSTPEPDR